MSDDRPTQNDPAYRAQHSRDLAAGNRDAAADQQRQLGALTAMRRDEGRATGWGGLDKLVQQAQVMRSRDTAQQEAGRNLAQAARYDRLATRDRER